MSGNETRPGSTWRGGQGSADGPLAQRIDGRATRYAAPSDVDHACDHPYCDTVVTAGETLYRSRNRNAVYCSKLCRDRHVRILVQQRRRADPLAIKRDREMRIKRKFGITVEQYETMYSLQLGRCGICAVPLAEEGIDTNVDHDHSCCPGAKSCGQCVRGLLCNRCNLALGQFDDDVVVLQRAINYLSEARETAPAVRSRRGGDFTS